MLSPLRYPGSKANLVEYFEVFLRENILQGCELVEPFAGGASLSLGLLERGVIERATLVERDPLVYGFWKAVVCHNEDLCKAVSDVEVSMESWKRIRSALAVDDPRGHDV